VTFERLLALNQAPSSSRFSFFAAASSGEADARGANSRAGTVQATHRATATAFRLCIGAWMFLSLQTAVHGQTLPVIDPTIGFDRQFGLGGHACKQYDDTGRLFIYSEGIPSPGVISWLQRSDNGRKANVPMPAELADALPNIPGCLPGKHHAAMPDGRLSRLALMN
jgi:hypothetical protein